MTSCSCQNTFNETIRIYGAATRPVEQGNSIIQGYISNLHCKDSWTAVQCAEGLEKFKSNIQYVQLKSEHDFEAFQTTLSAPYLDPASGTTIPESLRVFYLSVSPSLYDGLAASINEKVRPAVDVEMRVVFEKPFGRDLASAQLLSERLAVHLNEPEIFRVSYFNDM